MHSRHLAATTASVLALTFAPGAISSASAAGGWLPPRPLAPAVTVAPGGAAAAWGTQVDLAPDGTGVAGAELRDGADNRAALASRAVSADFGTPRASSAPGASVVLSTLRVKIDRQGNATAAWLRGTQLEVTFRRAGQDWGPVQTVDSGVLGAPDLAVGDAGAAGLAYVVQPGVAPIVRVATRGAGSAAFSLGSQVSPEPVSGDGIWTNTASIAMSAGGDVVVAWQRYYKPTATDIHYVDEARVKPASGALGPVRSLTSTVTGTAQAPPETVVTPGGRALVTWDFLDGTTSAIYVAEHSDTSSSSGSWTSAQRVSDPATSAYSPKAAVDGSGAAVLAFSQGSLVKTSVRTQVGGAFSAPKAMSDNTAASYGSVVAQSSTGDAIVAWPAASGGTATVLAGRRRPGTDAFGDLTTVASATAPAGASVTYQNLGLALDDQGNGFLSYLRRTGSSAAGYEYAPEIVGYDPVAPALGPIGGPAAGTAAESLGFTATATDRMSAVAYAWDFGDGGTASGGAPSHAYGAPGTYTVKVTATDGAGNASEASKVVQIAAAPSAPGGTASPPGSGSTPPGSGPTKAPPVVDAKAVLTATRLKNGRTLIKGLRVERLQRGDKLSLRCSGTGCKKRARRTTTFTKKTGSTLSLTSAVSGLRLAPKATLTVTISRASRTSRVVTFTMVRRKKPSTLLRCLDAGAKTARRC